MGKTSFELCDALTWSFGCTARLSRSPASVAITSFAFMLDEVPDPVWKTSTGNCSSQRPSTTSPAADAIASPTSASSTPSRTLTRAAACLTNASALMCAADSGTPEIGKFCTARCVCACHLACTGTRTSPIESCSIRSAACSPIPPTIRPRARPTVYVSHPVHSILAEAGPSCRASGPSPRAAAAGPWQRGSMAAKHPVSGSPARHVADAGGTALGIDIGGSGIKGAPVDLSAGTLQGERFRLETPHPAKPRTVAEVVGQVTRHFDWHGPIGITFPGVVSRGVVHTAANMDRAWIGLSATEVFGPALGPEEATPFVVNDADAAGLAEITHGAALGQNGVVLMLTFGTGIGSALFVDGHLVPNTELGHLQVRGKDGEHRASAKVRDDKNLSWQKWADRVQEYLDMVEALLSPDLVVFGGGVSKHPEKFLPLLHMRARMVPAQMANNAGIIGAALAASGAVSKAAAESTNGQSAPPKSPSTRPRSTPAKSTTAKSTPAISARAKPSRTSSTPAKSAHAKSTRSKSAHAKSTRSKSAHAKS